MNRRTATVMLYAGLVLILAGCACKLAAPLAADPPDTIHFILTGQAGDVLAFTKDPRVPQNCTLLTPAPSADNSEVSSSPPFEITYRCEHTTATTFTGFGEVFAQIAFGKARMATASLEPVHVAAGATGLKLTATTTRCVQSPCGTIKMRSWRPGAVCTIPC